MRISRPLAFMAVFFIAFGFVCSESAYAYSMPYYIDVDLSNNLVTVYSAEDDSIVRQMICSSGTANYPSPTGTYYMPEKYKKAEREEWYAFEDGYGQYGSRIWGNYLFHSYLFSEKDLDTLKWETYAAMGTSASHGCIRLYIEDAKWIADNCFAGTRVKLFYNTERDEYIKELIYGGTYSVDSGLSYEEYVCMADSEGELGYSSSGDEVLALQERMNMLGLYSGKADGYYGAHMVRAVKGLQQILGHEVTGVANKELIDIIYSNNCPTSIICTLSEGMEGPSVVTLQHMLASLGLYSGDMSGIYDEATKAAVIQFQRDNEYTENGIATPVLQQEMLAQLENLSAKYADTGYKLVYEKEIRTIATINCSMRLNLRASAAPDGAIIDSIESGTVVSLLGFEGDWAHISCNGIKGYVSRSYLRIEETESLVSRYTAAESSDAALPALSFENIARTRSAAYGTVSINSRLRLREQPDTESELVFMLSPGNVCEIISVENGWAYVRYGSKYGYTMAKYFDIEYVAELTGAYAGQ